MNIISRLFKRKSPVDEQTTGHVHEFLRVTTPFVDEMFQVDPADAGLPASALEADNFIHFMTIKGRRCAVNLRKAQTLQSFKFTGDIESTYPIRGVHLHLAGREDSVDIEPENADQFFNFFDELNSNRSFVKLGDYLIRKDEIVIAVASERFLDEWVWLK